MSATVTRRVAAAESMLLWTLRAHLRFGHRALRHGVGRVAMLAAHDKEHAQGADHDHAKELHNASE